MGMSKYASYSCLALRIRKAFCMGLRGTSSWPRRLVVICWVRSDHSQCPFCGWGVIRNYVACLLSTHHRMQRLSIHLRMTSSISKMVKKKLERYRTFFLAFLGPTHSAQGHMSRGKRWDTAPEFAGNGLLAKHLLIVRQREEARHTIVISHKEYVAGTQNPNKLWSPLHRGSWLGHLNMLEGC